jgi:hypothetical protein
LLPLNFAARWRHFISGAKAFVAGAFTIFSQKRLDSPGLRLFAASPLSTGPYKRDWAAFTFRGAGSPALSVAVGERCQPTKCALSTVLKKLSALGVRRNSKSISRPYCVPPGRAAPESISSSICTARRHIKARSAAQMHHLHHSSREIAAQSAHSGGQARAPLIAKMFLFVGRKDGL